MEYQRTRFFPKKPIRSFQDLEVYQRSFNASVTIMQKIIPNMKGDYPIKEIVTNCCLSLPNEIAEAYSRRFDDKNSSYKLMEESMVKCNKMIVYLEQSRDIFSNEVDKVVVEELIKNYSKTRIKLLNLLKVWKKFEQQWQYRQNNGNAQNDQSQKS